MWFVTKPTMARTTRMSAPYYWWNPVATRTRSKRYHYLRMDDVLAELRAQYGPTAVRVGGLHIVTSFVPIKLKKQYTRIVVLAVGLK
jgi:hypothetical protein